MSLSVTVATIQERVRNRLALPVYSTDTPVTTAEILEFVIGSAQVLSGIIGRTYGNGFFDATTTLQTVAGVSYLTLPTDFTYLIDAFWLIDSQRYVQIEEADRGAVIPAGYAQRAWDEAGWRPRLRVRAQTIELYPTPSAVYNVVINYTTGIIPTTTASVLPLLAGWDEWLVLDICVKCRQKEQKDAGDFIFERDRMESLIVSNAKQRDKRPKRIQDRRGGSVDAGRFMHVSRWR